MSRRLLHHTDKLFKLDRTLKYTNLEVDMKPRGLWVSCEGEDDWAEWCQKEEFHLPSLQSVSEVILYKDSNILTISNPSELYAFHKRYCADRDKRIPQQCQCINWSRVSTEYSGIIICPYQWTARLELLWYYGWDCASGCIWNLDVIESVNLITESKHDKTNRVFS